MTVTFFPAYAPSCMDFPPLISDMCIVVTPRAGAEELFGAVVERRERRAAGMAFAAIAEDLEVVADGVKTHRAAGVFLELFEFLRYEFDHLAAFEADHVLVMLMPVDVL